jgi:hypothetical protein
LEEVDAVEIVLEEGGSEDGASRGVEVPVVEVATRKSRQDQPKVPPPRRLSTHKSAPRHTLVTEQ